MFKIKKKSQKSQARLGLLKTSHGNLTTPFFMPIATQGVIKNLTRTELKKIKVPIILSNTYHLFFKPGLAVFKKAGGLHQFINWSRPILTDSGGFQVFSLDGKRKTGRQGGLVKVTNKGVEFKSVYDGAKHLFTPELIIKIQKIFGSDIIMVLDQCVANPCSYEKAKEAMERTLKWAKISSKYKYQKLKTKRAKQIKNQKLKNLLFGIVQGALDRDLRIKCVQELVKLNFNGYAIGGLAVGESPKEMYKVLDYTVPELPENKPRYLMGVGYPEQIIESVRRGIDMFDCVIPTREARHGRLYFFKNQLVSTDYYTETVTREKFKKDFSAINPHSSLPELREYSKSYLRHLFSVNEPLALRLATLNNLEFYLQLMRRIRQLIRNNKL